MPESSVLGARVDPGIGFHARRSGESVVNIVRRFLKDGSLDLPFAGSGRTAERWSALAALGRADLCVARLAEGHVDAITILHEAGQPAHEDALYGVWASRSGGRGLRARRPGKRWILEGTVPFCSGAGLIDRALMATEESLFDVDLTDSAVRPEPGSWQPLGMDATSSLTVTVDGLCATDEAVIGPAHFYTGRPGFHLGGAGVAAVWLGGAAGAIDSTATADVHDAHRLALIGELHSQLAAADALMARTATAIDERPCGDHVVSALQCRAVTEAVSRRAIEAVPMAVGPAQLSRDRHLAQHLADLQMYIGQYHPGADLARLAERAFTRTGTVT